MAIALFCNMDNSLKVSVLLATYNRSQVVKGLPLVERAIHSFLNQDYENAELIILENGSSDNTPELLQKYIGHPKITIHFTSHNKLPPNNWNYLWDLSDGDLICQLHDDDQLTPNSLSKRVKLFLDIPELSVVYGGVITQNLNVTDTVIRPGDPVNLYRIWKEEYINFTTLMYKRDLGFQFDPELMYYCDWLFKIRCLEECNVGYLPDPVMRYTVHSGQETSKCRREIANEREEKLMREKLSVIYSEKQL